MAIGRIRFRGLIRAASPFLLVFGALFLLIWPTVEGIVSRWLRFDESYSHGFLLLLVSVFLIFRVRNSELWYPVFIPCG